MKVMIVSDKTSGIGGMQRWTNDLVRSLGSVGVDATLVSYADLVHKAPPHTDLSDVQSTLGAEILSAARQIDASVVHFAQAGFAPLAKSVTEGGLRTILTAHGNDLVRPWFSAPTLTCPERLREALAHVHGLVTVSHRVASFLAGAGPVQVIPNGVDTELFRPGSRSEARQRLGLGEGPLLLTVGRLVPRKGVLDVIRSLTRLPATRYAVIGAGGALSHLQIAAQLHGVDDRVLFVGDVSLQDLLDWYHACTAFVMPTRELQDPRGLDLEGFGIVYLEAQACERPVVASSAGGAADAVGDTGWLSSADDDDALVQALRKILDDPAAAEERAKYSRAAVVNRFTHRAMAERYAGLYQSSLESPLPKRGLPKLWERTWPRLSVIIFATDRTTALDQAIESVLNQTVPTVEVLVTVDSSVESLPISRAHPEVTVVGLAAETPPEWRIRHVLDLVDSDLVAFQGEDGLANPKRLAVQWGYMQAHGLAVCGCSVAEPDVTVREYPSYLPLIDQHEIRASALELDTAVVRTDVLEQLYAIQPSDRRITVAVGSVPGVWYSCNPRARAIGSRRGLGVARPDASSATNHTQGGLRWIRLGSRSENVRRLPDLTYL